MKYSSLSGNELLVTISGGEPALFETETIFAIKYADRFLRQRGITPHFDIQTNGALITPQFATKLFDAWIRTALVSFHTNDRATFDDIIGVDYNENFPKILRGIELLYAANIAVDVNIVAHAKNIDNLLSNVRYLEHEFPYIRIFNIWFIQPHGEAHKHLSDFMIDYAGVASQYNRAVSLLNHKKRLVLLHFVGLPPCYLLQPAYSMEVRWNMYFRRKHRQDVQTRYLINNINDTNKVHVTACGSCAYNNVCSGIWREYAGRQRVKPIRWYCGFEGLIFGRSEQHVVVAPGTSPDILRKLFDGHKRFVYLRSSGAQHDLIVQTIRHCMSQGFYKICLVWEDERELPDDLIDATPGNIQIDLRRLSREKILQINQMSQKSALQFRMDLDIMISRYDDIDRLSGISDLLVWRSTRVFFMRDAAASLCKQCESVENMIRQHPHIRFYTVWFAPASSTIHSWK